MEKILIILPNWIGDVIMSLPVLQKARDIFPNNIIKILVNKNIFPLIEENCNILSIKPILYNKKDLTETLYLINKIKKEKFSIVFVLPRSFRMFFIAILSSIKKKYGYIDHFAKKFFFTKYLLRDANALNKHRVFYYLDILKLYKNFNESPELKLILKKEIQEWSNKFLKNNGIKNPIFGINPGATYGMAKCWDINKFKKLSNILIEKYNGYVLIFGGKDNLDIAKELPNKKNIKNLIGKLSIVESAALIKKCDIFITNDTGPMHIADALNKKIVAIFGSTNPNETPPFNYREGIIYKNLDCSPCKERICPFNHHKCMKEISVEEVLKKIEKIFNY